LRQIQDANEVLLKHGKDALRSGIPPPSGVEIHFLRPRMEEIQYPIQKQDFWCIQVVDEY